MLRRLSALIRGGKKVKLIGGPGNGMTMIIDGWAQSLEYEVNNVKSYYKWDGLTDGVYNLYSFVGTPNQGISGEQSIIDISNTNIIQNKSNLLYRGR